MPRKILVGAAAIGLAGAAIAASPDLGGHVPAAGGAVAAPAAPVTRAQAAAVATRRFPRYRLVRIEREDDHRARWEVTLRRGRQELEVYVSARGRIVHVDRDHHDDD